MTVNEAALLWGITPRQVAGLCRKGEIAGAKKNGREWNIPNGAKRPADRRVKSGRYSKKQKLPLPIGISDYRVASKNYYYIDKTLLIKDFIDERPMVSLFTRPRRFGKTLNMDMLRTFFEKTDEDTSQYFSDKKIWACGKEYRQYQGKFPVIFVSFKDVKCDNWETTYAVIRQILQKEFVRHINISDSPKLSEFERKYFGNIVNGTASEADYMGAFALLSQMLDEHYAIAPIIIIDECDTPIQQGYLKGFYEEVILFMRNLFSGGLKDNKHLSFGFLTGILKVAKESIFSGLNNLKVNSVLDGKYGEYFGFVPSEVAAMCDYYGVPEKYDEICSWYDGYKFGNSEIFNPWSVINYFANECTPRAFWQSTGNNEIIGDVLAQADSEIYERLNKLLSGKSIVASIDTDVIYPQIRNNPSSVYSFLLVAGYLKTVSTNTATNGDFICEVAIPNKEISFVYNKEILQRLENIITPSTTQSIQEALYSNNSEQLKKYLEKMLLESASVFDTVSENFYQGLLLGLCAIMDNDYFVSANRESGEGRYDISLMPKKAMLPGFIIELKYQKGLSDKQLEDLSADALKQIDEKKYDTEMRVKGISQIFKYGVAFGGKRVKISCKSA